MLWMYTCAASGCASKYTRCVAGDTARCAPKKGDAAATPAPTQAPATPPASVCGGRPAADSAPSAHTPAACEVKSRP